MENYSYELGCPSPCLEERLSPSVKWPSVAVKIVWSLVPEWF